MEDWRNADLQVDITGAAWDDEVVARVCVGGVGAVEEAIGAGRVAFPGLPADGRYTVTIDTLSEDGGARTGRASPGVLEESQPYIAAEWIACAGEDCAPCEAEGALAAPGAADWLLAVRFADATAASRR